MKSVVVRSALAVSATVVLLSVSASAWAQTAPTAPGAPPKNVQPAVPPANYTIGADDVLLVHYWRDADLSSEVVVRPDGYISLPLLRDVRAAGLTPGALAAHIQDLAAVYLANPNVTVVVRQVNSRKVFITGEVAKPGAYVVTSPTTVLQWVAMAGGLTQYARPDKIVVLRPMPGGSTMTFKFNYKKVSELKDLHTNITLLPGDTVVVR